MKIEYKKAICLEELRTRFRCRILVDGQVEECYVPSSSKLSHYVSLNNVEVLVTYNKSPKSKTKYRLHAVRNESEWIIVDLQLLNKLVEELYKSDDVSIKSEMLFDNRYKSDLFLEKEKRVIEVKGLISTDKVALIPMYSGERAIRQLTFMAELLTKKKYKVEYVLILLGSNISTIKYNDKEKEFKSLFSECIQYGMEIKCYSVTDENATLSLIPAKDITIEL